MSTEVVSIQSARQQHASAAPARLMSHATAAALRHALRALSTARVFDARLRVAASNASEDAHAAGMRVEQMLVAIKDDWAAHPSVRRLPAGPARSEIASRFISLCIQEFFAGSAARRDAAVGGL